MAMTKHRTIIAVTLACSLLALNAPAFAQEQDTPQPPRVKWSFAGPFGKFDEAQLQRGFKIYKEVCSNCHSLELLAIGSLAEPGGLGYSEAQAAAIADDYKVKDLNDKGEPIERAGRPADHFPSPFANELAAQAANGGTAPPDMSTLAKARGYQRGFPWFVLDFFTQYQEQGPDYIAALLNGYVDPPKDFKLPPGGNYNSYFPGHVIAMPPPLQAGQVTFDDASPQTMEQYTKDVSAFLVWAAEPHMIARKRIGFQVMLFLIVLAGLLYFTKKRVWSAAH
jgi:cytochrome c1